MVGKFDLDKLAMMGELACEAERRAAEGLPAGEGEADAIRRFWRSTDVDVSELERYFGRPRAIIEAALGPEVVAALKAGRPVYRASERIGRAPPPAAPEVVEAVLRWLASLAA